MSFFRQPGESSSDESSEDEQEIDQEISGNSAKYSDDTADDIVETVTTGTLSLTTTFSNGENGRPANIDTARDTITTALLEELARYRAADVLNTAARNSPEVEKLAKELFSRSSRVLAGHGIISPDSATDEKKPQRTWYLNELERASYEIANEDVGGNSLLKTGADRQDLVTGSNNMLVQRTQPIPATWQENGLEVAGRANAELLVPTAVPFPLNSHYKSSFVEQRRLGKGGFGEVFHARNLYDEREYAIKKIPLSPRLAQHYNRGGLPELKHILKEVQALAKLEHCNVVRYHATWLEEPSTAISPEPYIQSWPTANFYGQKLLDNEPAPSGSSPAPAPHSQESIIPFYEDKDLPAVGRIISISSSDLEKEGDNPFGHSKASENDERLLWSQEKAVTASMSYAENSDIFDDGRSNQRESFRPANLDVAPSNFFVLHVQMSMYPLTLAEYLSPVSPSNRRSSIQSARHCYHIVPSLKLLLAILHGLQYIHSQGYIHRDIKPGNIFLSQVDMVTPDVFNLERGYVDVGSCTGCPHHSPRFLNPRIGDFGLVAELERVAVAENASELSNGSIGDSHEGVGTQYYRPPHHEQKTNPIDEKLDVFALGVVLLELLYPCSTSSGRHDLLKACQKGVSPADLKEKLVAQGQNQGMSDKVEECLHGMLDINPLTRWRCAMVKSAIDNILTEVCLQTSAAEPD